MDAKLKQRVVWMRFFWACMLAMPLILGGTLLAGIVRVPSKPMPAHLPEILALCAVASVIFGFVMRSNQLKQDLAGFDVKTVERIGEPTGSFRDAPPATHVVAEPEATVLHAYERVSMTIARSWSMPVLVAGLGFYLGSFREPKYEWLPFFAVSIAILIAFFPRLSMIAQLVEREKNVRFPD